MLFTFMSDFKTPFFDKVKQKTEKNKKMIAALLCMLFMKCVQSETIKVSLDSEIDSLFTASRMSSPRDTIEFKAGVYPPQLFSDKINGTYDKPITVKSEDKANVVIDCSLTTKDYSIGIDVMYSSNIDIKQFTIKNCITAEIRSINATNVTFSNLKIQNSSNYAAYITGWNE